MFDVTKDNVSDLKVSTRMIAQEYLSRGARIESFYSTSGILQIHLNNHPDVMRVFSVIDEGMSLVAGKTVAGNKQVTNAIAKQMGIDVPDELYVEYAKVELKIIDIQNFINTHGKVVVKPVYGSHGNGVLTGVTNVSEVVKHAATIRPSSGRGGIIIQQQLSGFDIRIVCIDGRFASAMTRLPAFVVGDGLHSIDQLIDIENKKPERGDDYHSALNKIDATHVKNYLPKDQLSLIPSESEVIQVAGISNVGAGGIRKNIDDDIPDYLRTISERIAKEFRLPVCGVDFYVDRLPTYHDTADNLRATLIEVNNCPGITMYESFDDPRQKQLVSKLVDYQIQSHFARNPRDSID